MISALLDTTKILGKLEVDGDPCEVCAEAVAHHDRREKRLTVRLSAFLRAARQDKIGQKLFPPWLPAPEEVAEGVDWEEARPMADDIFASWCHRVSQALDEKLRG